MPDLRDSETVQELYAVAEGTRSNFHGDMAEAVRYYTNFVDFVRKAVPTNSKAQLSLLDVGCGCGWSSYAFAQHDYKTTGIDLNANAFEPPPTSELTLQEASMLSLPFADRCFDVVVAYQCLEHVPSPAEGLREMLRVCKRGGIICVVGPNCVSPLVPIKSIARSLIQGDTLWKRTPTTPHHPYGNTFGELILSVPVTAARLVEKLIHHGITFTMRDPDTVPPFHGDNDACYLCNPTDLVKFFSLHGCRIVQVGRHGRLPLSYLFASGTWVAAQKTMQ